MDKQMDHRGCHRVRTGTRGGPFGTKGKGKRHFSRARRRAERKYIRRARAQVTWAQPLRDLE